MVDLRPLLVLPGMVDLHVHLPQLPNAGVGAGLDLLTWLRTLHLPARAGLRRGGGRAPRARSRSARSPPPGRRPPCMYGAVFEPSLEAAFRAAEAHGIRAVIGKVMMDRGELRRHAVVRPGPRREPAPVGRPVRALAHARRRAPPVRVHAAVRHLVRAGHAAPVGRARPRDRRLLADARRGGPQRDPRGRAGCSPTPSTTSTSTTRRAASGRGRSSPTRSTCRRGRSPASPRPTRRSRTARPRTCSSPPGAMPLARYLAAGIRVGLGSDVAAGPGALDLRQHARRRVHPERAAGARRRAGRGRATTSRRSSRSTGSGSRPTRGRGRSGSRTRSARSRPARRPT